MDADDSLLNFAGVQLDLKQSYYQTFKSLNDYWLSWNTTFTTARTNYETQMAARQATIDASTTVLTEGVDYDSINTILKNTMWDAVGNYFANNSVPTYFNYE